MLTRPTLTVLGTILALFLAGGVAFLLQLGPSTQKMQLSPQTASATPSPTALSAEEELRELSPLNTLNAQPKWLEYQKGLNSSVHQRIVATFAVDAFRGLLWLRNEELLQCQEWHCAELDTSRGTNHVSLPAGYLVTEAVGPPSKPQRPIEYLTFWNPDSQQIETVTRAAGEPTVRLPEVLRVRDLKDLKVGEIAHVLPYALRTHQSRSRYCVLSDMPAWPEPVDSSGSYLAVSVKRISTAKYWAMVPEGTHLEKSRKGEKCVAAEIFVSHLY